ncbi:hypothetical protein E1301_Tti012828 [Triplophysa tibetana]|uniref:Uncharacterized protein n=1 Tax=Triplophysa tibetana TaxID=1572043 RepID=A0A5A9NRN3_9TELE|nr:hypothetical protein E1301_Tti012828 [Triplophysa tibetana]
MLLMTTIYTRRIRRLSAYLRCYIETPRTEENDMRTEQVEDGMEPAGQVETVMVDEGRVQTLELHTQDPHGSRGDMQTGAHSSAQDPQGKVEDDIEDGRKRLLGEEGSSQL